MEREGDDTGEDAGSGTTTSVVSPPPSVAPAARAIPPPRVPRRELPRVRQAGRLVVIALSLGWAFDALCGGGALGIGFPLFVLSVLGALFSLGLREGVTVRWPNVAALGLPLLFFAAMTAVRANAFLTFWNVTATYVLLLLLLHYSGSDRIATIGFGRFLGLPWRVFGASITHVAPAVRDTLGSSAGRNEARHRALPLLRGLLLALPALVVFTWLLASADAVFSRLLETLGNWLVPSDIGARIGHLSLALGAAWLIGGGFVYALTRREALPVSADPARQPPIGFVEGMTVLVSVAVVFIAFVAIQFTYLFGGIEHVKALGLNYATYARRGFWELVSVATLALALIHGLGAFTRREGETRSRAFSGMGTLLVALTLVLLASAFQRMQAYEAAWGATQLRLYVDAFIAWLAVALVWFAVTLWRTGLPFPIGALACGVGFLVTLNLQNPDDAIVHRNMAQCEVTGLLDLGTLRPLSDDAVPALCDAYDRLPDGPSRQKVGALLRLHRDEGGTAQRNWSSFHMARERARHSLDARAAALPTSEQAWKQFGNGCSCE